MFRGVYGTNNKGEGCGVANAVQGGVGWFGCWLGPHPARLILFCSTLCTSVSSLLHHLPLQRLTLLLVSGKNNHKNKHVRPSRLLLLPACRRAPPAHHPHPSTLSAGSSRRRTSRDGRRESDATGGADGAGGGGGGWGGLSASGGGSVLAIVTEDGALAMMDMSQVGVDGC